MTKARNVKEILFENKIRSFRKLASKTKGLHVVVLDAKVGRIFTFKKFLLLNAPPPRPKKIELTYIATLLDNIIEPTKCSANLSPSKINLI